MAIVKKPYAATINGQNYRLILNDDVYSPLASSLGLTKGTESTNYGGIGGLKDLRKAYALSRISVTGKSTGGTKKTIQVWCVTSKLTSALGSLLNLSFKSGAETFAISSASARLTTRFR